MIDLADLHRTFRAALLEDVMPFWMNHSLDQQHGGYYTLLDRQGVRFGTDKAMWLQARQVWMLSKLHNTIEPRPEWLDAAKLGYDFITQYGFDSDGRMFFSLTEDGRPLRKRRYLFTETFGAIAMAEYALATGDDQARQHAIDLYRLIVRLDGDQVALPPKVYPNTRQTIGLAMPMILIATTQELRQLGPEPLYEQVVDRALDQILLEHLHPAEHVVHETVGPEGQRLDSPEGRLTCPGHAIEVAWFLMHEGQHRRDQHLIDQALNILDWSLAWGWDELYGGILYYVDIEGRPSEYLEWDMKLWWPHTEALYATLLAYHLGGQQRYLDWHLRIWDWSRQHLVDPEHGEWFGYLHRDGSVSNTLKGNMWKGCFHTPRGLWLCEQLLAKMLGR